MGDGVGGDNELEPDGCRHRDTGCTRASTPNEPARQIAGITDQQLDDERRGIQVVDAGVAELDRLAEAVDVFSRGRLELPPIVVVVSSDLDECAGHLGLLRVGEAGGTIRICDNRHSVIVHELAHAWIAANVDQATRQHHLTQRGLESWDSLGVRWAERGTEDAAPLLAQILIVGRGPGDSPEWSERREEFELLTKKRPWEHPEAVVSDLPPRGRRSPGSHHNRVELSVAREVVTASPRRSGPACGW